MRRNKFSSAADRRWRRRYERIQQRKEEEREHRESREAKEYYEAFYPSCHDLDDGTVITLEALESAANAYIQEKIYQEFTRVAARFRAETEANERSGREASQSRGHRANTMVVDDVCGFTFKNGGEIIFHDLEETAESEQELEAGDDSALDAFLGEFLATSA